MAAQSLYQQQSATPRQTRLDLIMAKAGEISLMYWAHAITVALGMIVCAALSVPLLTYLGLDVIAKPIFFSLHLICAQIPAHSFYILGHQLGMCARNMSIYTSMFIGGLIFVLSKKRLRGIPWWLWLLMILPMAYDGLTQMFGLRESTWELRVLTGTLFGFGNMWFVLPFIQRTLLEMMDTSLPSPLTGPVLATQAFATIQTPIPVAQPFMLAQTPVPVTQPLISSVVSQHDPTTPLPESRKGEQALQAETANAKEGTMVSQAPASPMTEV